MSGIVLVADDDDDILLLVTTRLKRDGFEVVAARNGIEVLAQIRADETLAGTRVLLLTAKAQESDVRRGYAGGADAYVKKPFSPAELSTRVKELLEATPAT